MVRRLRRVLRRGRPADKYDLPPRLPKARADARRLQAGGGDGCSRLTRFGWFLDEAGQQLVYAGVQCTSEGDDGVEVRGLQSALHLSDEGVAPPRHGAEIFLRYPPLRADAAQSFSKNLRHGRHRQILLPSLCSRTIDCLAPFRRTLWCSFGGRNALGKHFSIFEQRFSTHEEAGNLFENATAFSNNALVFRRRR